jgi:hypothetical protein
MTGGSSMFTELRSLWPRFQTTAYQAIDEK